MCILHLFKNPLTGFMKSYFTFYRRKDPTTHCGKLKGRNVCIIACWFTEKRESTFSVQGDQPAGPTVLRAFSDNVYEDFKQILSKEEQTIYEFFNL
jgi:hypothetical protein